MIVFGVTEASEERFYTHTLFTADLEVVNGDSSVGCCNSEEGLAVGKDSAWFDEIATAIASQ